MQQTQQNILLSPPPPGLTMELWSIASSAMGGSNFNHQQFHARNTMENSAVASLCRGRGGGNHGAPRCRAGAGTGQGGTSRSNNQSQNNSECQRPPHNPIHASSKEEWNPPQDLIATWTGTKPAENKPICYYCALPNHTTSECVRRRQDLKDNIDRPYHPDRGHLGGCRYSHRIAQKLLRSCKGQNAAQAMAQVERAKQAMINKAKIASTMASSASSAPTSVPVQLPPRVNTPQYANIQFPTYNAPSHNQGGYNTHYFTNANAAVIAPLQQPMFYQSPVIPQPMGYPAYFLPPSSTVPDLRMVCLTQWADKVNIDVSTKESRRANQVHNLGISFIS